MRHLNIVFRAPDPTGYQPKSTPYLANNAPTLCWGCEKPFPIRDGHREALVGQDGRLYCYNMTHECAVLAVEPVALRHAS